MFSKTKQEHDEALHDTLSRLHTIGLTVNLEKCVFGKSEIEFFGFVFSADGLRPDPSKVRDLKCAKPPASASEVRSLLGMAQFSARFIPRFASITEPLRLLTRKDTPWYWDEKHEEAVKAIKDALSESATNAYFEPGKPSQLVVDASPVGLAAILAQNGRPVCYASRSLSATEQNYSQTEREALAVVWGCEHYDIFLRGAHFDIITDHKPLLGLWKRPTLPLRLARWSLRLQPYSFVLKFRPGKDNPSDYLSRHPTTTTTCSRQQKVAEEYVNFVAARSTPIAMSAEEVRAETACDPTLLAVIDMITTGNWHASKQLEGNPSINKVMLRSLSSVREELSVNETQDLVLRDDRIVIPEKLQKRAIELAHEGHQGITKTKAIIRSKVWFPTMDKQVERAVQDCLPCQVNSRRRDIEPLNMSPLPKGPWTQVSMDFCGPLPSGDYLMVIIDEYSRYPVVEIVRQLTANSIIPAADKVFAAFGYPEQLKTDNGPPFQSTQWHQFLHANGVKHRKITPLWPQANAQAERINQPLIKAIRSAVMQNLNWKQELQRYLHAYRCTPHCSTQHTPFRLMFGRNPRTKLPHVDRDDAADRKVRLQDDAAKRRMKAYADKRFSNDPEPLKPSDQVLVRQEYRNKFSTPYSPNLAVVTDVKGAMVTVRRKDGSLLTRNRQFFRKLRTVNRSSTIDHDLNTDWDPPTVGDPPVQRQAAPPTPPIVPDLPDNPSQSAPAGNIRPRRDI